MNLINIENKSGKVKLNEVVTRESIGRMIDEIGKLFGASASAQGADFGDIMNAAENAVDVLEIEINSPGGSVFDGYTIYQEIQSLKDRGVVVNATITGMAASMASVICMACNKVSIVPHGRMMIHDASSGFAGNADQMRKQADLLDSISSDIANIYSERTGKEVGEIRAMMKKETWMDAKATVKNGFADEIAKFDKEPKAKMSILAKLFPDNDQVAKLEASFQESESLRNDLELAQARINELAPLAETNATLQAELSAEIEKSTGFEAKLKEQATEFEAKSKEQADKIEVLEKEVEVTAEKVSIKASEILAEQGHPEPVAMNDESGEVTESKATRAQFNAMTPSQKSQFCLNGGKIK